jgi:hypothetical protein
MNFMSKIIKFCTWTVLLGLCISFSSCLKDEEEDKVPNTSSPVGLWALYRVEADIANPAHPEAALLEQAKYAAVNIAVALVPDSITIEFKSDKSIVFTAGDEIQNLGTYSQEGDHYIFTIDGQSSDTNGLFSNGSAIRVAGDVLTVSGSNLDEIDESTGKTYREGGFTKYGVALKFRK